MSEFMPDTNFYELGGDEMAICPCGMPVAECDSQNPEPEKSAEQLEFEAKELLRLQRLDSLLLNLKDPTMKIVDMINSVRNALELEPHVREMLAVAKIWSENFLKELDTELAAVNIFLSTKEETFARERAMGNCPRLVSDEFTKTLLNALDKATRKLSVGSLIVWY